MKEIKTPEEILTDIFQPSQEENIDLNTAIALSADKNSIIRAMHEYAAQFYTREQVLTALQQQKFDLYQLAGNLLIVEDHHLPKNSEMLLDELCKVEESDIDVDDILKRTL